MRAHLWLRLNEQEAELVQEVLQGLLIQERAELRREHAPLLGAVEVRLTRAIARDLAPLGRGPVDVP